MRYLFLRDGLIVVDHEDLQACLDIARRIYGCDLRMKRAGKVYSVMSEYAVINIGREEAILT